MIARIWHGWTTPENADRFEWLVKEEIFVGIQNRRIPGFNGIQLLRRESGEEVEFVTIMLFDSLVAVRDAEDLGDLHGRPAIDVAEQDHLALGLGQLVDRHLDHVESLLLQQPLLGPCHGRGRRR